MRRASAVLLLVAALLLGACSSGPGIWSEPTSTTLAGPPPALPDATSGALARLVDRYGTGPTRGAQYVLGTRNQARHVLGMGGLPKGQVDSEVFVVVLDGAFTLQGAGDPDADADFAPKGEFLVTMFSKAHPEKLVDLGVTDLEPPLARVGQVGTARLSS